MPQAESNSSSSPAAEAAEAEVLPVSCADEVCLPLHVKEHGAQMLLGLLIHQTRHAQFSERLHSCMC
jgi:hypothetical protein